VGRVRGRGRERNALVQAQEEAVCVPHGGRRIAADAAVGLDFVLDAACGVLGLVDSLIGGLHRLVGELV
jgi:hypothetical protein